MLVALLSCEYTSRASLHAAEQANSTSIHPSFLASCTASPATQRTNEGAGDGSGGKEKEVRAGMCGKAGASSQSFVGFWCRRRRVRYLFITVSRATATQAASSSKGIKALLLEMLERI